MGLPYDPVRAAAELAATDPRLAGFIERIGPCRLDVPELQSPFEALARAIVYQQLSGKAAATIFGRVETACGAGGLTPAVISALPDEALRGAGMSRAKVAAVRDLALKTTEGVVPTLRELRAMSDEEIVSRLTVVRGVGRWTVEMLLIARLGRPDVMPATDLGVRKGYRRLIEADELPAPDQLLVDTRGWSPWRSVAAWYLWRIADQDGVPPKEVRRK